jgi:hypothetical protein
VSSDSIAVSGLTADQRRAFQTDGFVHLPAVFEAAAMQDEWWAELAETRGALRDDPVTWRPQHGGLKRAKQAGIQRRFETARTKGVIDALLGVDTWDWPRDWGTTLVTFPCGRPASEWDVPADNWHWDNPTAWNRARLTGLFIVALVGDVRAAGGGTLVLAGSPQLVLRHYGAMPAEKRALGKPYEMGRFARSHPWLAALTGHAPSPGDRIAAFMRAGGEVDGVPVRVVELTGDAGDVIVCHPLIVHSRAPNCGTTPRMMRIKQHFKSHEAQWLTKAAEEARRKGKL